MTKKNNSFTFSFNKKNQDILEMIKEREKVDKNFAKTNYFCEAVRFYEKYKDKVSGIYLSQEEVKTLLENAIKNNNQISFPSLDVLNATLQQQETVVTNEEDNTNEPIVETIKTINIYDDLDEIDNIDED